MARWRRLARKGNRLLACAIGGITTHGDSLWTEPRFLAVHPLYRKTAIEIDDSDLMYVHYGDSMSFMPKFRKPSYSYTDSGVTVSISREIFLVGSYTTSDAKLPYHGKDSNGRDLYIDDLNSHGVSVDRYPAKRETRYTFSAKFVCRVVEKRTRNNVTTTKEYDSIFETSVTVIFKWDSGTLEPYKWEPTDDEIEVMGQFWDVTLIDDDSVPPIRVDRGDGSMVEYVYEAIDDEDFPVGVDYRPRL